MKGDEVQQLTCSKSQLSLKSHHVTNFNYLVYKMSESCEELLQQVSKGQGDVFTFLSFSYHRYTTQRYSINDDIKPREAAYPHIWEAGNPNPKCMAFFSLDKFPKQFLVIVQMNFRWLSKSAKCLNTMYNWPLLLLFILCYPWLYRASLHPSWKHGSEVQWRK